MDDLLARIWDDLLARAWGPMWFRLILQPLVAISFGVRAGLRNARSSRGPAGQPRVLGPAHRRDMLQQGRRDLGNVVFVGILLDVIVQLIVLRAVYPGETLLVVTLVVIVPYQIIRTVVARLARKRQPSPAD